MCLHFYFILLIYLYIHVRHMQVYAEINLDFETCACLCLVNRFCFYHTHTHTLPLLLSFLGILGAQTWLDRHSKPCHPVAQMPDPLLFVYPLCPTLPTLLLHCLFPKTEVLLVSAWPLQ